MMSGRPPMQRHFRWFIARGRQVARFSIPCKSTNMSTSTTLLGPEGIMTSPGIGWVRNRIRCTLLGHIRAANLDS